MKTTAIIGMGVLGRLHAQNLKKIRGVKLVAVCEKNFDFKSKHSNTLMKSIGVDFNKVNFFSNSKSMYASEKIDFIINALPTYLHTKYNLQALEHNCHVFTEKPFALNSHECDIIINKAMLMKRTIMVGHCMRFWPGWMELKTYVDKMEYGQLKYISLKRSGPSPVSRWFFDRKISGGVLFDLQIHDIDFLNFLFGMPRKVYSRIQNNKDNSIYIVATNLDYDNTSAVIESGWHGKTTDIFMMNYKAVFEKTVIKFENEQLLIFNKNKNIYVPVPCLKKKNGYCLELQYFVDCLQQKKRPLICTPKSSRDTIRIAEIIQKSAKLGKVQHITKTKNKGSN